MVRKQLIMDKALELFADQGFEATSVQRITDYCGISKGAFYLSFKSKDELIIALIDHFMEGVISNIDYVVRVTDIEDLLYSFYYSSFQSFHKHSDFGKIFIQEQAHSLNEDLLIKMRYYQTLMDKAILSMIERLYGEKVTHIKYDLMYCINSFMRMYSDLFLFNKDSLKLDLDLLSKTLVEKTDLLAKHMSAPFVTEEVYRISSEPLEEKKTKEQLIELLKEKIKESDESIEKESLTLLKDHLIEPTLSVAIVKGLLENIQRKDHCKWISYLLRRYFEL